MQQHLTPIWDAIDEEQFAYALQLIEKAQKRYRKFDGSLASLKALCLAKEGRSVDAITVCEQIRLECPGKKETYQAINDVLKSSASKEIAAYLVRTMEEAFKVTKTEALGRLWFMVSVRAGDFSAQRRAAQELQKGFLSRDYFYLVLQSMLIIYNHFAGTKDKSLLGMLMHRMITKAASNVEEPVDHHSDTASQGGPRIASIEEYHLFIQILEALDKHEEIISALNGPHGKKFASSLEFSLLKLNTLRRLDDWRGIFQESLALIKSSVDDWTVFAALIEAYNHLSKGEQCIDIQEFIKSLPATRNSCLAAVCASHATQDQENLYATIEVYMDKYGDRLSTYEDLSVYVRALSNTDLQTLYKTFTTVDRYSEVGRIIVITNLAKFRLLTSTLGTDEYTFCQDLIRTYSESLSLGTALKETDNQYGDDLLLLAIQRLATHAQEHSVSLQELIAVLEHALQQSKHNFQIRLVLIGLYRRSGAWSLAFKHFQALHIKHIQRDTLSYILFSGSSYEYISTMQISQLKYSQSIYYANEQETPDMICQAFENRTYSKVLEMLEFQQRLSRSVWWLESRLNIWDLQILLDKFDFMLVLDTSAIEGILYDNKSRNIMLDLQASLSSTQKSGRHVPQTEMQLLQQRIRRIQIMQAMVMNDLSFITMPDSPQEQAGVSLLLETLLQAKRSGRHDTLECDMQKALQEVVVAEDALSSFGSDVLQQFGHWVDCLKSFSVVCQHLQKLPMKSCILLFKKSVETCTRHLETIRQTQTGQINIGPWANSLVIEAEFIARIEKDLLLAQRESITCFLGVLKSIRL